MLTLHDSHGSTNAIKVRVLLHELGLDWQSVELEQWEPRPAGYTDLHPFGLIPTLVDDALVITESNVALRYLAEREGRDDLRGATPRERAVIDGLLDSLSLELRPALWGVEEFAIYDGVVEDEADRVATLERQLTAYDTLLHPTGPWATGERFTIADCAQAGRALHLPKLPIDPGCAPRLRRVRAALEERPAFRAAITPAR